MRARSLPLLPLLVLVAALAGKLCGRAKDTGELQRIARRHDATVHAGP